MVPLGYNQSGLLTSVLCLHNGLFMAKKKMKKWLLCQHTTVTAVLSGKLLGCKMLTVSLKDNVKWIFTFSIW